MTNKRLIYFILVIAMIAQSGKSVNAAFLWRIQDARNTALGKVPEVESLYGTKEKFRLVSSYSGLCLGVGIDHLEAGRVRAIAGIGKAGCLNLEWSTLRLSNLYYEDVFNTTWVFDVPTLLGLGGSPLPGATGILAEFGFNILRHGYTPDEYSVNDPVFLSCTSKQNYSCNFGTVLQYPGWIAGIRILDLLEPDVGLASQDYVPLQAQLFAQVTRQGYRIANIITVNELSFLTGITYRNQDWGSIWAKVNPAIGFEGKCLNRSLTVRAGINSSSLSTGVGLHFNLWGIGNTTFDYTCTWPYSVSGPAFNHLATVTFSL